MIPDTQLQSNSKKIKKKTAHPEANKNKLANIDKMVINIKFDICTFATLNKIL